jgi:hypothetical protein
MLRYIMGGPTKSLGGVEAMCMGKMGAPTMVCLVQMHKCQTCFPSHTHALDPYWAMF